MTHLRHLSICAGALLALSSCDPDPRFDPACPTGTIGCPCLPDGTCDEGICIEDLCVDADVGEPLPPQDDGGDAGFSESTHQGSAADEPIESSDD